VHGPTFNVLKLLMEADPSLFDECSIEHRKQEEELAKAEQKRQTTWQQLIEEYNGAHPTQNWVDPTIE
jgi:serine/threonine-protein phosphatase 2A regulatory subunit B'